MLDTDMKYLLTNAFARLPNYVFIKDSSLCYRACNENFARFSGFKTCEEIDGMTDYDMSWSTSDAQTYREQDHEVIRTGNLHTSEVSMTISGERKILVVNKMPLYDDEKKIVGVLGFYIDISEKKAMEDEIIAARDKAEVASRAKSEFIANMSHDIRTPITGILAMAKHMSIVASEVNAEVELEARSKALTRLYDVIQEDQSILVDATNSLLSLCNEILELVRLDAGKIIIKNEGFSLQELLQHAFDLLQPVAKSKALVFTYDIDPSVPEYLKGGHFYLGRILFNLISNALKFTEQGYVKVLVQRSGEDTPYSPGDKVVIKFTVSDSGMGIPEDKQSVIFENFSRLTSSYEGVYDGSGLGLYMTQRYIESLDGTIGVESQEGKGSCFSVEVPLQIVTKQEAVPIKGAQMRKSARKDAGQVMTVEPMNQDKGCHQATDGPCVLVVEDSRMAYVALEVMLRPYNCYVEHASTAQQGVDWATEKMYDLVLMDVGLPDFSGIEATRLIREKHAAEDLPIIAVTGHADDPEQCQACMDAGMQVVLSKPATADELAEIFSTYCRSVDLPDKDVIDWVGCVQCCQSDKMLARHMLSLIVVDWKEAKSLLSQYADQGKRLQLRAALQRLRGNVTYLRLPELARCLQVFHDAVRSGDQEMMTKGYDALQKAWLRFEEQYRAVAR